MLIIFEEIMTCFKSKNEFISAFDDCIKVLNLLILTTSKSFMKYSEANNHNYLFNRTFLKSQL